MAAITRIALQALARMPGPRVVLAAVPGGSKAVAKAAGVSAGRVSQVLRQHQQRGKVDFQHIILMKCCNKYDGLRLSDGTFPNSWPADDTFSLYVSCTDVSRVSSILEYFL